MKPAQEVIEEVEREFAAPLAARPQDIFCVARAADGRILMSCPGSWPRGVVDATEAFVRLEGWFRTEVNRAIRATPGWSEALIHTVQIIWTRPDGDAVVPPPGPW